MQNLVNNKLRSPIRELILEKLEGKPTKDSMGMLDPRLFNGENSLYAVMDTQTCIWGLRYKFGILPLPLRQRFTSFSSLLKHVEDYFKKRNMRIARVID